jgi:hypothetical protein
LPVTKPVKAAKSIKTPADEPPVRSIPVKEAPPPRPDSSPPASPAAKPKSTKAEPAPVKAAPAKIKSIHAPADAATIAHNQKMEAEWHAKQNGLKLVELRLRELCPNSFNDNIVPLKIGIHHDINQLLDKEFEQDIVGQFLRMWVRRYKYREAVKSDRDVVRFDLSGEPVSTCQSDAGSAYSKAPEDGPPG